MITDDTLSEDSIVLLNFIPDKYKDSVLNGDFSVFYIEDIVVISNRKYTDDEISSYSSQNNFSKLEYPYTVQAELDFKEEYGT